MRGKKRKHERAETYLHLYHARADKEAAALNRSFKIISRFRPSSPTPTMHNPFFPHFFSPRKREHRFVPPYKRVRYNNCYVYTRRTWFYDNVFFLMFRGRTIIRRLPSTSCQIKHWRLVCRKRSRKKTIWIF